MEIGYRPATEADYEFLYRLHRDAMRDVVEDTWGVWDEDWQRANFRKNFSPEVLQVIRCGFADVGVIYRQERAEEIFLANLEILPAYQRRGIGTAVVRALITEAAEKGKPVALRVLKANLGARRLYQSLGFGVTGETGTHYIMMVETHP